MTSKKKISFSIAIDGSSASGKTTGSKIIAKNFGFKLLSSGKLYRYIAYKLFKDKKKITNKLYLKKIASEITLKKLKKNKLYDTNITTYASSIAKIKFIRNLLKQFQKNFSKNKKFIIEGRDIASKIIPKADLKLFFYCSLLFLPALFIFYEWGGITKSETTSGINESAFKPQNLLFSITIISLYLVPFFYLFSDKKKYFYFIKKNILFNFLLFFFFYFFIRLFYLDVDLPISGGWAFKIYKILININFIFAEIIFFLICFFSYIIIFSYFKFFNVPFVSKIIIIFLASYSVFIEIVFQEYFDPLMLILCIFFFHKEQFQKITFQKSLILYSYFLIFWLGSLFYYHFYIF